MLFGRVTSCCLFITACFLSANLVADDVALGRGKPRRELEGDRPDATESPISVDKGFFQVESSFFRYTRDRQGGTNSESWGIGESNIKHGITDNMDLQLIVAPYVRDETTTAGVKRVAEDVGDLTLRLKYNFWGNDEGQTAFGLMPVVKIPTQTTVSNGRWEGGLVAPFAWRGGERWGLGLQAEVNRIYSDVSGDMEWAFRHTAVVGIDVTDKAGIYLEYLGVESDAPYNSYFSSGVTYDLGEFLRLDAGTLVGLNSEAEDLTVFSGFTWKF